MKTRIATYLLLGLLISTIATGCVHQQQTKRSVVAAAFSAEQAPKVDLVPDGAPIISTVSNRLEPTISFADDRSNFEKQFYPGETDPHRWRDAVTILPLESFQPGFEKIVRRAVLDSLQDALKYDSITVKLQSFHVALDERERGEAELLYDFKNWDDDREEKEHLEQERKTRVEANDREWRNNQRQLGLPTSGHHSDESFSSKVFKGIIHETIVQPAKKRNAKINKAEQLSVAAQTLPTALTGDKKSGWNCHVKIEVTLNNNNVAVNKIPITVKTHAEKEDVTSLESQMQNVVAIAIKEIGLQMRAAERQSSSNIWN